MHIPLFLVFVYCEFGCCEMREVFRMASDNSFINRIERGLLTDLVGLYTDDLVQAIHDLDHWRCIPCSKEAIVQAIDHYRDLDSDARVQVSAPPAPA